MLAAWQLIFRVHRLQHLNAPVFFYGIDGDCGNFCPIQAGSRVLKEEYSNTVNNFICKAHITVHINWQEVKLETTEAPGNL